MRNAYKILVMKSYRKRPLTRHRHRRGGLYLQYTLHTSWI